MPKTIILARNEHRELLYDAIDEDGRGEYGREELKKLVDRALNNISGVERALVTAVGLLQDIMAEVPPTRKRTVHERRIAAFLARTCKVKDADA